MHASKRHHSSECPIAVVSQDHRFAVVWCENNVEIAVEIDIERPRTGIGCFRDGSGKPRTICNVDETLWSFLLEQTQASGPRCQNIGFEIVIQIGERDGCFRCICKRKRSATLKMHPAAICPEQGRPAAVIQPGNPRPEHSSARGIGNGLWSKA